MNKTNQTKPNLYLIPSVISEGTEEKVITPQIRETIKGLKFFMVENVRTARRFISSLKLGLNIEELNFVVLDKDTKENELSNIFKPITNGNDMGVLSEAGCPGIADPGSMAVNYAHKNNIRVIPLAGPSSIFLALMASGFSGQSFTFHGYLPIDKEDRRQLLKKMEKEAFQSKRTQIFMETPYRNNALLQDLLSTCEPMSILCIACDLTADSEYVKTLSIQKWGSEKIDLNKRPTIFLIFG